MKLKYILVVSLILAILTLGAVSASDDANNLTAVDDAAEAVSQVDDIEVVADDNSNELVGDNSDDESLSVGDQNPSYDIICPEKVRMGPDSDNDDMRRDFAGVMFYNNDISGNLEFYIDDVLTSTKTAQYYDVDYERGVYLNLYDLNIASGLHNVKIKYSGDDNYAPFEETRDFELYYMDVNVPETVIAGGWSNSFKVIFDVSTEGTLDFYLDDEKVATYDVYDLIHDDEWGDEYSVISIDITKLTSSYSEHTYTLNYYNGNHEDKTLSGSFILDYLFEINPDEGEYIFGEPIDFDVYMPDDASGNMTLLVNGKRYKFEIDGYDNSYEFSDLALGETDFTFTYEDDDKYPEKTVTVTLKMLPRIVFDVEWGDVFYNSQDQNVSLTLPNDANGNLSIYKQVEDGYGGYKWVFVKSVPLQDGKASVAVSDWGLGPFHFLAKYTGGDYEVEDLENYFEIFPNVDYPTGIWNQYTGVYQIIIQSPEDADGNLTVRIRDADPDYEDYWDEYGEYHERYIYSVDALIYEGEAKGIKTISLISDEFDYHDLESGRYSLLVGYEYATKEYTILVSDKNPDWIMEVIVPKEVGKDDEKYEEYDFWPENCPSDDGDAWLHLYIDGKLVESRMYDDDGEFECSISKLSMGTHTWKVTYTRSIYFSDASAEGTFEVVWITIPEEVIDGVTIVDCHMDENATGYISLSIDGKDYAMEFVEDGYASFKLANLTFGEHTYEFRYSGDANHEQLTKTGSFNNTMKFEMNDWLDYDCMSIFAESYPVSFELPSDATGTIRLTVGDKTYTQDVVDGTASFEITGLDLGRYKLVAVYSGDDKYPTREISKEFEIYRYGIDVDYADEDDLEDVISVSLTLPSGATGSLVLYKEEYDDETGESDYKLYKTFELENGKAKILASDMNLPIGYHNFRANYVGDESYAVDHVYFSWYVRPVIDVPESVNMGEDATINIDLVGATGNIVISINGDEFKTVELENGKISVAVPSDKLTDEENIVTFRYVGEDLKYNPFGYFDDDDEFVPYEYKISVELKEMEIPSDFAADGTGNITFELPEGSSGNVTVYVDDEEVSKTPVTGGTNTIPVSGLSTGDHTVKVVYEDENGKTYSSSNKVNVPKPEPEMEITAPTDSANPEFSINLPEDATGSLIVTVDGKNYAADLVKGKATVSVPGLEDGNHSVTVRYTGDNKYSGFTKNTNVVVNTTPKKEDTPQPVPETEPAKKVDKITLKLKKVKKVKRSAKKLVIKATLKINGKAVKGKKLKFKFNKIKYTAKTNKKGVAKIKVTKKVLKKLKAGKKVKIQVSYGKKTVKQKVKVKK